MNITLHVVNTPKKWRATLDLIVAEFPRPLSSFKPDERASCVAISSPGDVLTETQEAWLREAVTKRCIIAWDTDASQHSQELKEHETADLRRRVARLQGDLERMEEFAAERGREANAFCSLLDELLGVTVRSGELLEEQPGQCVSLWTVESKDRAPSHGHRSVPEAYRAALSAALKGANSQ